MAEGDVAGGVDLGKSESNGVLRAAGEAGFGGPVTGVVGPAFDSCAAEKETPSSMNREGETVRR